MLKIRTYICWSILVFFVFACKDSNDFRDIYVGDYTGGYNGNIYIIGTGASRSFDSKSGVISVSKDKSSIHHLNIQIDDRQYNMEITEEGGVLHMSPVHYPEIEDDDYDYDIIESADGTITPSSIQLTFQYGGTATFLADGTYMNISGSGACQGSR